MNRRILEMALLYASLGSSFCPRSSKAKSSRQVGRTWEEMAAEREAKRRAREERRRMKIEKARKKRE